MTGFGSDVKHLVRLVTNAVAEHKHLYGGKTPSIRSIVSNTMSSYMRDATIFGGSWPFGVQGLVVGN